ncbi:PaaI family thioesterase [uncultured Thiothrix sp.]|uniref:PaaI family thioesterase n=1 Tax=uncultured Thiothrix sp. TaxID=223185 RepID=UPI0026217AA5|nr:PaaI family thioesterase [uncultured Thiothrix sp.]
MDLAAIRAFIAQEFPQTNVVVEAVGNKTCRVRQPVDHSHLRPGGTVSGPTQMLVGDIAIYIAILHELGPVALAVTTNLSINFLNKPAANTDLVGECKLLKLGKRLVIGEVYIYSVGNAEPVAHVVGTYSIPPGAVQ